MTTRDEFLAKVGRGIGIATVTWQSEVKTAAAHRGRQLVKVTTATVMTGVEYANLAVNDDRETGALPWGTWETYPHVVSHRGGLYARLYTVDGTLRTVYMVDGQVVTREAFNAFLTPSARKSSHPNGGTVTVHLENLTIH